MGGGEAERAGGCYIPEAGSQAQPTLDVVSVAIFGVKLHLFILETVSSLLMF